MNIESLDLNLLRLFASVYQTRSVSRSAVALGISQPAASHGLTRLRLALADPLFARAHGGVRPTPVADRLAQTVALALGLIDDALRESERFDPASSRRMFKLHLSDIGEARFLPELMAAFQHQAPLASLECRAIEHAAIAAQLDTGEIDFAFGFLPTVTQTERIDLLSDRYVVMVRCGHPVTARAKKTLTTERIKNLEFVAVRSHLQTVRILEALNLSDRTRLFVSHFLALPEIVRSTDLAVLMPSELAHTFAEQGGYEVLEPQFGERGFIVSLHWSRRRELDPARRWLKKLIEDRFATRAPSHRASRTRR